LLIFKKNTFLCSKNVVFTLYLMVDCWCMKKIIISFLAYFSLIAVYSQDRIYTSGGEVIQAKILEIKEQDITYQRHNDPSGVVFVIAKSEVQRIVFQNGIEEIFHVEGDTQHISGNDWLSELNRKKTDMIYLTDGTVIECEVVEKKRFGVNYIPTDDYKGYVMYLSNTKISKIVYGNGHTEYISGSPGKVGDKKSPLDFSYLSPSYVGIGVGPAIPFGSFSVNNSGGASGNAYTGFHLYADATYYLFRGMGFSLLGGYIFNPYEGSAFRSYINAQLPTNATQIETSVGNWNVGYLAAGIGYYNDFGRLFIDYKAMVGAAFSAHPTGRASYVLDGNEVRREYQGSATSFLFGGAMTMRYYLTRKWSVFGNVSVMFSRATFPGIIRTEFVNGTNAGSSVAAGAFTLGLSWINVGVGAAFTIGN
jgi:hypothetical protein